MRIDKPRTDPSGPRKRSLRARLMRRAMTLAVVGELLVGCATGSTAIPASGTPTGQPRVGQLTLPPDGVPLPYPDGCSAYGLSTRRCAYIAEWAAREAGVSVDQATIQLLGDPACDGQTNCVVGRTTQFVVRMRVISAAGETSDHPVFCGVGGQALLSCTDTPTIFVSLPTDGYHDIPCGDGGTCASPVPSIDPKVSAEASPLIVPRVVVPIGHVGDYVVDLGDAILPNGILSVTSVTLADDQRTDVLIPEGVRLDVTGDDGTRLVNVYEQGWRAGIERVHAQLRFTVEAFEPGATLDFTDIVVG